MLLLMSMLVTYVSCLVASSWDSAPHYDLSTKFRNLISEKNVAHQDFVSSFSKSKRTTPAPTDANVNNYLARCPHNQIPEYITVNRNSDGALAVTYSRDEIWAAMNAGIQRYNIWIANPDEAANPRLRFGTQGSGSRYPHPIAARERALRGANYGSANTESLWIFPIRHATDSFGAIWGGGVDNPSYDRGE